MPDACPELLLAPSRAGAIELEVALGNIKRQYGSTLFTALVARHGDITGIWDRIVGDKHNEKLVRAGALLEALQ